MQNTETVKIELNNNPYNIVIGNDLLSDVDKYLKDILPVKTKIFLVSDENVSAHYGKQIIERLSSEFDIKQITLKPGEETKSFNNLQYLCEEILSHQPERGSCLIALGGGVIGDLTGFAASVILRGVNFIQIPTSLLAMVDSSVGGKTAINTKYGKNLVGSFYQPKLVLADLGLLKTLPEREILAGYAEIVKYGLIGDLEFFEYLEQQSEIDNLAYLVKKSCEAKAKIVAADEKEKSGLRALLNLGHTFGHSLEAICNYDGSLLHGEAVAIGMVLAFRFSEFLNLCPEGVSKRVENLLKSKGLRTKISAVKNNITIDEFIHPMYGDKKVEGGKLVFILAENIGKALLKKDVDENKLREFLKDEITR